MADDEVADDEARRIGPGDLPTEIVLSIDEAFDVAEALESAQALADLRGDVEAGIRAATALSIIRRALGVA